MEKSTHNKIKWFTLIFGWSCWITAIYYMRPMLIIVGLIQYFIHNRFR